MDVQIKTVNTESFSMDCCMFGRGQKSLMILPGLSVQSIMPLADAIAAQYRQVTDDYTVYVFDRRKGTLPPVYTVQDMADDTAEAAGRLGIGSADIFGASQGGMMAMLTAIRHPGLAHKIVIGSSSACISDELFEEFDKLIRLAKEGRAEELFLDFDGMVYPKDVFEGAKDMIINSAKTVTPEDLARFISMTEGMRGFDITGDLEKITCPAFVIGSNDDNVLGGEASVKIAEGLKNSPDCELYMYDGFGHAVYDLAPDYRERMLAFLKK